MDNWSIVEGEEFREVGLRAIGFFVTDGTEKYPCAVSDQALNDHYQTPDTEEAAMGNYKKATDALLRKAIYLIRSNQKHPKGYYFIDSTLFSSNV